MKQYPSYRDSGIPWLNEIPSHWRILPGRAIFQENKEKNDGGEHQVLSLSYGNIIIKKNVNEGLIPENYSSYQYIRPGYIVIRCTDLQNDKVSLRTSISEHEGIITGAYLGLIPKPTYHSKYIHYLLRAWDCSKELYRYGSGLRQSLSWNDFKYLLLPIPSPGEQVAIVDHLDAATAKIDEAIAQQQSMIDLLNERKQILIDRAVSRGVPSFNHTPVLKDSGYDWLGQIPANWDMNKLKYLCKMYGRIGFRGYSAEDLVAEGEGAVTLSPTNIIDGKLDFTECSYLSWQKYNESPEIMVFPGDVVFVKTASVGKTAYVESIPIETTVNPQILVLKEIIPNSEYLTFYLQSSFMQGWVKATANGSTILTIPQTTIGNYPIVLPSPNEQQAIVDYLKGEIGKIERAKASVNSTINLLQERKQIIINDIVTGKVKVV